MDDLGGKPPIFGNTHIVDGKLAPATTSGWRFVVRQFDETVINTMSESIMVLRNKDSQNITEYQTYKYTVYTNMYTDSILLQRIKHVRRRIPTYKKQMIYSKTIKLDWTVQL